MPAKKAVGKLPKAVSTVTDTVPKPDGKRRWTPREDSELCSMVKKDGTGNWPDKAARFTSSRDAASLRSRWLRALEKTLETPAEIVDGRRRRTPLQPSAAGNNRSETAQPAKEAAGKVPKAASTGQQQPLSRSRRPAAAAAAAQPLSRSSQCQMLDLVSLPEGDGDD